MDMEYLLLQFQTAMELYMPNSENEQKKCDEYDAMLPRLWEEGLLTDFECRMIASSYKRVEKEEAVHTVIMSKTKEEAAILMESFETMAVTTHAEENSTSFSNASSCKVEENYYSSVPLRNPFLNNTIITHLFGFLPLQDMKRFRLVCREWNSIAQICLRKRSAIHFRRNILLPRIFMEVSKYYHADLPFSSFVFSNDGKSTWQISDIQDFLKKWENNLKGVTFNYPRL